MCVAPHHSFRTFEWPLCIAVEYLFFLTATTKYYYNFHIARPRAYRILIRSVWELWSSVWNDFPMALPAAALADMVWLSGLCLTRNRTFRKKLDSNVLSCPVREREERERERDRSSLNCEDRQKIDEFSSLLHSIKHRARESEENKKSELYTLFIDEEAFNHLV